MSGRLIFRLLSCRFSVNAWLQCCTYISLSHCFVFMCPFRLLHFRMVITDKRGIFVVHVKIKLVNIWCVTHWTVEPCMKMLKHSISSYFCTEVLNGKYKTVTV